MVNQAAAVRGNNSAGPPMDPPRQASTARKVTGIVLISGGAMTLAAGGILAGIYFSSSFAQSLHATSLNGTLMGRIALFGAFAGGAVTLGIGIYLVTTSRPYSRKGHAGREEGHEVPADQAAPLEDLRRRLEAEEAKNARLADLLAANRKAADEQVAEFQNQLRAAQTANEGSAQDRERAVEGLRQQLQTAEAEKARLAAQAARLRTAEAQVAELQSQLSAAQLTNARHSEERRALDALLGQLRTSEAEKTCLAQESAAKSRTAEAQVAELRSQLSAAQQAAAASAEDHRRALDALRQQLQASNAENKLLAEASAAKSREAEAQLAELRRQLGAAQQAASVSTASHRQALGALQQDLEASKAEKKRVAEEAAAQLKTADARIEDLQGKLSAAEKAVSGTAADHRKALDALRQTLQTSEDEKRRLIAETAAKLKTADAQVADLQRKLDAAQKDAKNVAEAHKKELDDLSQKLRASEAEKKRLAEESAAKLKEADVREDGFRRKLDASQRAVDQADARCKAAEAQVADLQNKLDAAQRAAAMEPVVRPERLPPPPNSLAQSVLIRLSAEQDLVLADLRTNDYNVIGKLKGDQIISVLKALGERITQRIESLHQKMEAINRWDASVSEEQKLQELKAVSERMDQLAEDLDEYRKLTASGTIGGAILGEADKLPENKLKAFVELIYACRSSLAEQQKKAAQSEMIEEIAYMEDLLEMQLLPLLIQGTKIELPTIKGEAAVFKIKSDKYALMLIALKDALVAALENGLGQGAPGAQKPTIHDLKIAAGERLSKMPADWADYVPDSVKNSRVVQVGAYAAGRAASYAPGALAYIRSWFPTTEEQAVQRNHKLFMQHAVTMLTVLDDNNWTATRNKNPDADEFKDSRYLDKVRSQFLSELLPAIRGILEIEPVGPIKDAAIFADIARCLAVTLYSDKVDLETHFIEMVRNFSKTGAIILQDRKPLGRKANEAAVVSELKETFEQFGALPGTVTAPFLDRMWKSFRNNNHVLDPNMEGNPTHSLFSMTLNLNNRAKQLEIKAYGTPTVEGGRGTAVIVPEFKAFLEDWGRKGKKHMHVSYQSYLPVHEVGVNVAHSDETDRNNALVSLQREPRFANYYGIVLSKDSKFYHQKGDDYAKEQNAPEFRQQLLDQFFKLGPTESGCYISEKVKAEIAQKHPGESLEGICKGMIDAIQDHMFKPKGTETRDQRILSVEEKKKFIEIFYVLLVMKLAVELDLDSMSGVCKDMIDRGMMAILRLFGFFGALHNREQEPPFRERLKAYTMARAYEVRKRVPIQDRFVRAMDEYDFILKSRESWKALCQRIFPGMVFHIDSKLA